MSDAKDIVRAQAGLPSPGKLIAELDALADEVGRKRRIREVITLLGGATAEEQQDYRDALLARRWIRAGDWKSSLSAAKKAFAAEQQRAKSELPDDAIDITTEPDAIKGIWRAIRKGRIPDVYAQAGHLAEVAAVKDTVAMREVDHDVLRSLLTDHVPCARFAWGEWHAALPQVPTCKAILARTDWRGVPELRGIALYPVMREDGSVLQECGYDPVTGFYMHHSLAIKPVPERPSAEDIRAAKELLLGRLLRDFPWVEDADRANYVSLMLTPLLRDVFRSVSPFGAITAPERGSGKTLLGKDFPEALFAAIPRPYPGNGPEMRKSITAVLREPDPVVVFDNVPGDVTIRSEDLAMLLTTSTWADRILQTSTHVKLLNDRLWLANGTNLRLGGDFGQRTVLVRIDPDMPHPDRRTGFAIPKVDRWIVRFAGEVIRALLVLASAWHAAGGPRADIAMRGFTEWAEVTGGILGYHEIPGFLANRDDIDTHDDDAEMWTAFLQAWRARYGEQRILASRVVADAAADKGWSDLIPGKDGVPISPRAPVQHRRWPLAPRGRRLPLPARGRNPCRDRPVDCCVPPHA